MALSIPIISEFDGKGVKRAIAEFKQLEGAGAKAQFALKKAAIPAAAALTGLAAAATVATKAAIADQAAQRELARTLQISAEAGDAQVAAVERQIAAMEAATGIADDQLRPAYAALVRGTKNVEQATGGLQMALDISAATGKDLTTVSEALSMAYQGNMRGLRSLSPEMAKLIKEGADLDTVMSVLGGTFGGAMAENAATAEGRMRRFGVAIENAQENIGYALLPVIEATLPFLEKLGMLAQEHTTTFVIAAGVIGGLAAAILVMNAAIKAYVVITKVAAAAQAALNFVLTANPIGVVVMAIAALVAGLVLAYNKSETFRNAVNAMFNGIKTAITASVDFIKGYLNTVMTFYKTIFNGIATAWNSTVGKLSFRAPDWIPGIGGRGFDVPDIPMLASGGIITRPTMAILGEAGPEAVVPLDRMRGMGTVTVNVNGGLATSAEIGEAVVNAIRQYNQVQGPANIAVA
jgi:hypothetical protein